MKINTKLSIAALALFMSLASYAPVNAQENGAADAVTTAETASKWQNIDGNWYYIVDGVKQTGWVGSDAWYFMNEDGVMQTGWVAVDGLWYHLDQNGRMQTGWVAVDGAWYYMNHSGGAMVTGWVEVDGLWYFMNHNGGAMLTGWLHLDDTWYFLNHKGGAIVTGWFELDGNKYHFDANGVMETGWLEVDGKTYYLQEDGVMATNIRIDDMEIGEDGVAVPVAVKVLLDEEIKAAEKLGEKDYTKASWKVFNDAKIKAIGVSKDKKATDLQAAAALESLRNAEKELVIEPADKVELYAAILANKDTDGKVLKSEDYTAESWEAYQEALDNANALFTNPKALQSDVDAAVKALNDSKGKLKPVLAGKRALEQAIKDAETDLVEKDYTPESWAAYLLVKADAQKVLDDKYANDTKVQNAITSLEKAIDDLVLINGTDPDSVALYKSLQPARLLKEEDYSAKSWKPFNEARETAETVFADKKSSKKALTDAKTNLDKAMADLVNVKELKAEIKLAKEITNEEDYTPATWAAFEKSLEAAELVLENPEAPAKEGEKDLEKDAAQTKVNDAASDLKTKNGALVYKSDRSVLNKTIAEASKLKQEDYASNNWEAFANALAAAKLIDENSTEGEITSANTLLDDTMKKLVNISSLNTKISAAKALLGETNITTEPGLALNTAITKAENDKNTLADADAVVVAINELDTAMNEFKEAI